MNYSKIYDDLIQSAKLRPNIPLLNGYSEKHHIIPRSMGGSNNKDNIVSLTAREHFIAHWLLWRIHRNEKMAYAFMCMFRNNKNNSRKSKRYFNSRAYEIAKKATSIALKGKVRLKHTPEAKRKIAKAKTGLKHTEESKRKMSEYAKNRTKQHHEKIALKNRGRKASEETKKRLSEFHKNQPRTPEWCRKIGEANSRRGCTEATRQKLSLLAKERHLKKLKVKEEEGSD